MLSTTLNLKSILVISRMSADGTKLLDEGALAFDGHDKHPTVEGPKFYQRNGYFYIFAPAGGVEEGWQLVLRSKNVYGIARLRRVCGRDARGPSNPLTLILERVIDPHPYFAAEMIPSTPADTL